MRRAKPCTSGFVVKPFVAKCGEVKGSPRFGELGWDGGVGCQLGNDISEKVCQDGTGLKEGRYVGTGPEWSGRR